MQVVGFSKKQGDVGKVIRATWEASPPGFFSLVSEEVGWSEAESESPSVVERHDPAHPLQQALLLLHPQIPLANDLDQTFRL